MTSGGDSARVLRLPFQAERISRAAIDPDAGHVILVGKVAGGTASKLFLVPFDGSATRVIGEMPRSTEGLLALSPDGKLLAYTSDGAYTTKILEIDFGPALQAIMRR